MSAVSTLTPSETDLLLYLEVRLVEHRGKVRSDQIRPEELALAQRWHEAGFIGFTDIRPQDVDYSQSNPATHRVTFSEQAWALALAARRARAA